MTSSVYMYLVGFIILFIAGAIIQYKYFNRFDNKNETDPKHKADLGEKESLLKQKK